MKKSRIDTDAHGIRADLKSGDLLRERNAFNSVILQVYKVGMPFGNHRSFFLSPVQFPKDKTGHSKIRRIRTPADHGEPHSVSLSQRKNSRCQTMASWGSSTQWFSFGKYSSLLLMPCSCAAWKASSPCSTGTR